MHGEDPGDVNPPLQTMAASTVTEGVAVVLAGAAEVDEERKTEVRSAAVVVGILSLVVGLASPHTRPMSPEPNPTNPSNASQASWQPPACRYCALPHTVHMLASRVFVQATQVAVSQTHVVPICDVPPTQSMTLGVVVVVVVGGGAVVAGAVVDGASRHWRPTLLVPLRTVPGNAAQSG